MSRVPGGGSMGAAMDHPNRPRPSVTSSLCGAALAVGAAAVFLLAPGPEEPVRGTLHAAADVVRAPRGGRVARWLAEPGAAVRPGRPAGRTGRRRPVSAELAAADDRRHRRGAAGSPRPGKPRTSTSRGAGPR